MLDGIEDLLQVKAAGSINSDAPTPLYFQLYALLKGLILDGSIAHTQRLPAEEQLAKMFSVSRITAKRAMDELAQDGLVERRRGRGSHVIYRFKARPVQAPMIGVLEEIERVASLSTANVLECHVATPPHQIREELGLPVGGEALHLVRVRENKGREFGYYASWTAWQDTPPDAQIFKTIPRLRYFKERGLNVNYALQTIGAAPATPAIALALNVPEGTALLRLVRRSFWKEGEQKVLKDHLNIYYNPEYFQYEMEIDIAQTV